MHCEACGGVFSGDETCLDHFHALLAAEAHNDELRRMHGLTVLTYHLQHPSLTKPWFQIYGAETMRRVFGNGENWSDVLMETHPRGIGRRRAAAAMARLKASSGPDMPAWAVTLPIPGELTVASVDPAAASGQEKQVIAWAHSVAVQRVLKNQAHWGTVR